MSADRSTIYAVGLNSGTLSGVTGYNFSNNLTTGLEGHDGSIEPRYGDVVPSILEGKPMVSIRTKDVATVLSTFGMNGVSITACDLYWQKRGNKGTRATGANHGRLRATSGFGVLQSLSARNNQKVIPEVAIYPLSSDGLSHPFTGATGVALAGTLGSFAEYTLGPVWYVPDGGSAIQIPCQGWDYEPNVTITHESDDGLPYPDYADMEFRQPSLKVDTHDMPKLLTSPMLNGGSGSAVLFLRKMLSGSTRVADNVAEHVKLTLASCLYYNDDMTGELKASGSVRIQPVSNGSVNAVQISTASTITAP